MRWLLATLVLLAQEGAEPLRLTKAEFVRRRADLAGQVRAEALVVGSGPLRGPGDDANATILDFRYLTGFHDAEGLLVLRDGKAHLFTDDPAGAAAGCDEVLGVSRFPEWAAANLDGRRKIAAKIPRDQLEVLRKAAPGAEVAAAPLRDALVRMRLVKSEAEVRLVRKASEATCAALLAVAAALRPGMNERDVQEIVLATFKAHGCPEVGFPPILGAGMNGTVLHYHDNDREIAAGTLLLCDIGAAIEGYSSDVTRTFPVSGRFSAGQRRHYQCVLDALKAAEKVLRAGATYADLERAGRGVFEERGLTRWSFSHSRDRSVRHGIGHYVGLNVHDSGSYMEKFLPGMIVTIEPGWYDKDAGYGIRIEDIYLVTKDGFERLSAAAPREIGEVERAMRPKREY